MDIFASSVSMQSKWFSRKCFSLLYFQIVLSKHQDTCTEMKRGHKNYPLVFSEISNVQMHAEQLHFFRLPLVLPTNYQFTSSNYKMTLEYYNTTANFDDPFAVYNVTIYLFGDLHYEKLGLKKRSSEFFFYYNSQITTKKGLS